MTVGLRWFPEDTVPFTGDALDPLTDDAVPTRRLEVPADCIAAVPLRDADVVTRVAVVALPALAAGTDATAGGLPDEVVLPADAVVLFTPFTDVPADVLPSAVLLLKPPLSDCPLVNTLSEPVWCLFPNHLSL